MAEESIGQSQLFKRHGRKDLDKYVNPIDKELQGLPKKGGLHLSFAERFQSIEHIGMGSASNRINTLEQEGK